MMRFILLLLISGVLTACSATAPDFAPARSAAAAPQSMEQAASDRSLVRSASIDIAVDEPADTEATVRERVEAYQGYIENTFTGEDRIRLTVKIPEPQLEAFVDNVAAMGEVLSRSFSSHDVTEQMIDIDARLENLYALRERFRTLLERAESVTDVLAIEKELSRIQSDIDSIERRREALQNQVAYSRVNISIEQQTIYGPLGYVAKGLYWLFGKLFVIR